jgi:hypothetical protein
VHLLVSEVLLAIRSRVILFLGFFTFVSSFLSLSSYFLSFVLHVTMLQVYEKYIRKISLKYQREVVVVTETVMQFET